MSHKRLAATVIAAVVLSSFVGWIVGSRVQSPADAAARTQAPPASPILVPVESRVLSADVVTRGTARFGSPQQVILAPSALKATGPGIIDTLPVIGAELIEGDIALTASGRPVIVLQGTQPSYRDLGPGLIGTDVRQLEAALTRLGFDPGPVDEEYDETTGAAVAAWYESIGYAPAEATESQLAGIRALENELGTARIDLLHADQSVVSAQTTRASAQSALDAAILDEQNAIAAVTAAELEAQAANDAGAADVAAKRAALDRVRAGTPAAAVTQQELSAAEADLQTALANAEAQRVAGERAVIDALAVLDQAPIALAAARAAANTTDRAAAADVAAKRAVLDDLAAKGATAAELAIAGADLETALANAQTVRAANDRAIAEAQAAVDGAPAAVAAADADADSKSRAAQADVAARQSALDALHAGRATQPPVAADVDVAEADLRAAELNAVTARLTGARLVTDAKARAVIAGSTTGSARVSLLHSEAALDLALQEAAGRVGTPDVIELNLALAKRRVGVQVPADEVVFVPSLPIRVSELTSQRSGSASGPVMLVTDAVVTIDGSLALDEASLVAPGMTVRVDEPDLGIASTGVVERVAATPGTNGVDGFHIYFATRVDSPPPNLVGSSVRLTIAVESTGGAALVVPVNAVTLAPDGSSRVERDNNGTLETVTVEPGLSAAGFVAVRPLTGSLAVGDLVSVGIDGNVSGNLNSTPASGTVAETDVPESTDDTTVASTPASSASG